MQSKIRVGVLLKSGVEPLAKQVIARDRKGRKHGKVGGGVEEGVSRAIDGSRLRRREIGVGSPS